MGLQPTNRHETQGGAGGFAWCAQYDLHSRGESPPWAVMTGTIRPGKGVRREADLKKADDEIAESTYRKRILGHTEWVTRPGTGNPIVIRNAVG